MHFYFFLFVCFWGILGATPLEDSLRTHIHFSETEENRIGKIVIEDRSNGISQATWIYVKSALDYYKKHPPIFVILELNTPGGEVFSAQKISDALKELDTQFDIPVVAFINNWAISAGAMLAYSSRYISVVKDGSMGAAEPVLQDVSGEMKSASEKVNSALRADFASRASFFDRNPDIAEAMVDKDLILVMREGKIIKLDSDSQVRSSDEVIKPKGKLLTLNARELIEYGVADFALKPEKIGQITLAERESGKWPAAKEPLFQVPFFASIPHAVVDEYQMDWKTLFFAFLASPIVSSALFLGLMIGGYLELNHPGLTLPGIVAGSCLFLLILSSFSLEIADWLEVILLLTGIALLLIDLFFLPTFGLLGGLGVLLFIAGLAGIMLPGIGSIRFEMESKTFNAAGEAFLNRLGWLIGTVLVGSGIIVVLARYVVPSTGVYKRFVLQGDEQVGYVAGIERKNLPPLQAEGVAVSALRPAGKVKIENNLYDAISAGRFIDKGAQVIVSGYDGSTLIVRQK